MGAVVLLKWSSDGRVVSPTAALAKSLRVQLELIKAGHHKYIRRVPTGKVSKTGKPIYRYFYNVRGGRGIGHKDEFRVGAAFQIRSGQSKGHYHITAMDGNKLTIRHDETGHTKTLSKDDFAKMLRLEHQKKIHDVEQKIKRDWHKARTIGTTLWLKQVEALAERYDVRLDDYFPSGSNHAGEIAGFTDAGMNVGVAVNEVNSKSIQQLKKLAGTKAKVFVDSGAFGEISFNYPKKGSNKLPKPDLPIGVPYDVKPITEEEWEERLALYDDLARTLGTQAYLVAPDKVADQQVTLERLEKYAGRVRKHRELGAQIIVPIQKGSMSMAEFDARVQEILGFDDYIRGVPMKKDATTVEEFSEFLRTTKPKRVHLLGMGTLSEKYPEVQKAAEEASNETNLTLDAVRITALVGYGGPKKKKKWEADVPAGTEFDLTWFDEYDQQEYTEKYTVDRMDGEKKGKKDTRRYYVQPVGKPGLGHWMDHKELASEIYRPNPLTYQTIQAEKDLKEFMFKDSPQGSLDPVDYTDLIGSPHEWMTQTDRNNFAAEVKWLSDKGLIPTVDKKMLAQIKRDPDKTSQSHVTDWLHSPVSGEEDADEWDHHWIDNPMIEQALNTSWAKFYSANTVAEKKKQSILKLTKKQLGDVNKSLGVEPVGVRVEIRPDGVYGAPVIVRQ